MAEQKAPKGGPGGPGGPGGAPRGGFQKPKNLRKTLARLFTYLAHQPVMLVFAVIFVILASAANIAGTYIMRPIINDLAAAAAAHETVLPSLVTGIVKLLAIYFVAAACTYGQCNLMAQLAQKGCNKLRRDLFDRLQEMPLSYFDKHTHGELMSRFTNDADNVQVAMEQSLVQLVSSALTFVGTIAMMIYLSPLLFLVTVVMLAAIMLVFKKLGGVSRKYYKRQQAALGAVNGNIQETIEGLKVVKAFTHEPQAKETFRQLNEDYRDAASKANFYSTAIMPLAGQLTNAGYAVTAGIGGLLAVFSGFDIGGLVSFLNYSKQVSQPVNQISMQLNAILSAMAGAERIFEVMDARPEVDEGKVVMVPIRKEADGGFTVLPRGSHARDWAWKCPQTERMRLVRGETAPDGTLTERPDGPDWLWRTPDGLRPMYGQVQGEGDAAVAYVKIRGRVEFHNVSFSYVPGKEVLHDINVYAKPGQKIAFVGSTGAGKTTITNLINRFYEIQSGTITYDGIDVREIEKDSLRHSLGAVLQDTHLFTGTVMDNIRYGRLDATDEECIQAAKTANAHSFIRRLPDGYQTMVTGDGANLSQGQRQLLAIARAAVADPPVMVLDEATSSIDTRTEAHISKGMDALMEGRTVFVIAHRLSTVRNANAIAVIEAGKIIEKGSHEQLLEQKGRYYQLYTGQFQLS